MNWGILITIIGIIQIAMGTFLTIYGPSLIHKDQVQETKSESKQKLLTPQQLKLLNILYKIQSDTGANKLIISSTDGVVYWDNEKMRAKYKLNIFQEFYSIESDFEGKSGEFENLVHSIPDKYLQRIPEMRVDSPYVARITEDGIKYIQDENSK